MASLSPSSRIEKAGPLILALQKMIFERLSVRIPGTRMDMANGEKASALQNGLISCPTLIIHGHKDHIVPYAHAQQAQTAIPHARLMSIQDGDNVSLFTHMDQIRQEITLSFFHHKENLAPDDEKAPV